MNKILCKAAVIIYLTAAAIMAKAQMPYHVSTLNEAYVPLTNGTRVNGSNTWSDTSTFVIPVGFSFNLGGNTVSSLTFSETSLLLPATSGVQNGFAFLGTSLQDRNYPDGPSVSPIRYTLSGNTGSRIFKLEISNAGFVNEKQVYNTMKDSVNIQVWIYESNGAVEFRFGASGITHFADYFSTKVPLGFMRNLDMETFNFTKFYTLKGSPASPVIDSITSISTPAGMDGYPANGIVYRFQPKGNPTPINAVTMADLGTIFPVPAGDVLFIESRATRYEIVSLNGTIQRQGSLVNGKARVLLAGMTPGLYLARLYNNKNEMDIHKFIKQ